MGCPRACRQAIRTRLGLSQPHVLVVPIRMSSEQWDVLRREARELGIRPTTLLRMWVRLPAVPEQAGTQASGEVVAQTVWARRPQSQTAAGGAELVLNVHVGQP